ncbi:unnamed protein product [Nippostrongylus brasiliensis]|uniref:Mitochondrial import inner membrane translocase subunit Tim29 n=1 Tax=Nippostrongylus brasiliensis TaxID=27835 RepID=A0A0N4XIQ5_NIPBR|nr:unnamed protein product [Nippostrongylus brasiliensis]
MTRVVKLFSTMPSKYAYRGHSPGLFKFMIFIADRPIRRVASKLSRKPTNEIERLRKKGDQWTANDLFRFQYSDPEEGTSEERRELCYAWLDRLHAISKKYCYLAWYEAAIYACYYRLAPILTDREEKRRIWTDVKREYAQVFLMGRRIWRRPSHPSRLRVFYDMAMLCVRFGNMPVSYWKDFLFSCMVLAQNRLMSSQYGVKAQKKIEGNIKLLSAQSTK